MYPFFEKIRKKKERTKEETRMSAITNFSIKLPIRLDSFAVFGSLYIHP